MRAILDAHPDVRCGQETRVIPRIIQFYQGWLGNEREAMRLDEAGLSKSVLETAVANFCLEVIVNHGYEASRYCNKDPLLLKNGLLLNELFPNLRKI